MNDEQITLIIIPVKHRYDPLLYKFNFKLCFDWDGYGLKKEQRILPFFKEETKYITSILQSEICLSVQYTNA